MDVLQITPRQGNPMPVGDAAGQTEGQTEARVPELRTIFYTFSPPGAALDAESTAAPAGLIRRELDFETPAGASDALSAAADAEPSVGVDTDLSAPSQPPDSGSATAAPAAVDDRWTWVPEVVSLEFRYFDGSSWSSSWNSLLRGSLPVAVEVRIALGDPKAPAPMETTPSDADANLDADGNLYADADAVQPPAVSSAVTNVQMIVDLPSSAEYRKPRVADSTARSSPARSTARRIVPRRWTSPGASPQRPEDWLRTSTP
jgi:hypothetical protein